MELAVKGGGGLGGEVEAGEHTNVGLSVPYWMGWLVTCLVMGN